ncbi:NUDIX hydrolase [Nocardia sp. NPDC051030]|uniref:NUDIX hydrolase n=1 Tax=Nocardia sp. NPDC051030 TaxID=3155162 RepID=UPI00343C9D5A
MRGDGNGWFRDLEGIPHWGRYGAAGLLLRAPLDESSRTAVLLQRRARGRRDTRGTWTIPGGARDSHESAVEAAVREAWEETRISPRQIMIRAERITTTALGGWTYTTVVADAPIPLPTVADHESDALRWIPEPEVTDLPLHPDFRAAWPRLRAEPLYLADSDTLCKITNPREITRVLPRTVDLTAQGFAWIYRSGEPTSRTARLTEGPIPFYQRPTEDLLLRPNQLFDRL